MNRENDKNIISQNEINQKNVINMNKLTEDALNQDSLIDEDLTKEEIEAYLKATDDEIPDLWDKITEGYDKEIQAISEERSNISTSGVNNEQSISTNVVDISTSTKYKKKVISKYLLAVAALALLVIIAAPIIKSNTRKYNDKSKDVIKSDEKIKDVEQIKDNDKLEDLNNDEEAVQNESNSVGEIEMIPSADVDSNQSENVDVEGSAIEDEINSDDIASNNENTADNDGSAADDSDYDDNDINYLQPTEEIVDSDLDSAGNTEPGYEGTSIYLDEDMIREIVTSRDEEISSLDSASTKLFAQKFNSIIFEKTDYVIDDLAHAYKAAIELENSSMEIYIVYGYVLINDTTYKADENDTAELIEILGY